MAQPWTKEFRSLRAVGGQRNCLSLPFPRVCRICRIAIKQVGGTVTNFSFRLYNSEKGCGEQSSSGGAEVESNNQAQQSNYRVGEEVYNGSAGEFHLQLDTGFIYENRDGLTPMTRIDRLYMDLVPTAAGEHTFDISFTCEMDI